MEMLVNRSSRIKDEKPCEEAYSKGTFDTDDYSNWELWYIQIPDLQALQDFIDKYGKVIIFPARYDEDGTLIREQELYIYDDYME